MGISDDLNAEKVKFLGKMGDAARYFRAWEENQFLTDSLISTCKTAPIRR